MFLLKLPQGAPKEDFLQKSNCRRTPGHTAETSAFSALYHVKPSVSAPKILINLCVCVLSGMIQHDPTGISLWMGGHDSITEGGWEWMDGSPFRYVRWNAGSFKAQYILHDFCQNAFRKQNVLSISICSPCFEHKYFTTTFLLLALSFLTGNPDDYNGEDCLSILINNGYWNDDNCEHKRGYICKRRGEMCCFDRYCNQQTTHESNTVLMSRPAGNTPEPPPPHDGNDTSLYGTTNILTHVYPAAVDLRQT